MTEWNWDWDLWPGSLASKRLLRLREAPAVTAASRRPRVDVPNVPGGDSLYLKLKGLWNDPGSGRFVKRGRSTAKAQAMMFEPGDAVREVARGRGRVRARVADNRMARSNIRKGDVIEVSFKDDEFGVVEVLSASGKKRKYDVKWARFDQVEADGSDGPEVPEPSRVGRGMTLDLPYEQAQPFIDGTATVDDVMRLVDEDTGIGLWWGELGDTFDLSDLQDYADDGGGYPNEEGPNSNWMREYENDGTLSVVFLADKPEGWSADDNPDMTGGFSAYGFAGSENSWIDPEKFGSRLRLRSIQYRAGDGEWATIDVPDGRLLPIAPLQDREIVEDTPWTFTTDRLGSGWKNYAKYVSDVYDEDYNGQKQLSADVDSLETVRQTAADNMAVRVPFTALPQIVEAGRLKSQHETGTSKGLLFKERREGHERLAFGTDPDIVPKERRPIYGYIENGTPFGDSGSVSQYGEFAFRLRPEVAPRATITFGDSLGGIIYDGIPDKHIIGLPITGEVTDEMRRAAITNPIQPSYIELQVHNGVTLRDIREVHFAGFSGSQAYGTFGNDDMLGRYAESPVPNVPLSLGQPARDTVSLEALDKLNAAGVEIVDGPLVRSEAAVRAVREVEADILRIAVEDGGGDFPDCLVASEEINKRFGLPVEQGFFYGSEPGSAYNKMNWGPHAWVRLPDGSILDLTSDQFSAGAGSGVQVIRPGDPSFGRYWTEGKGMWETRSPDDALGWLQAGGVDVVEAPPMVRGTASPEWFDSTIGSQPWYHVTEFDRAAAILANGLDPSYGGLQSDATAPPRPGAVYLAHKTMVDAGLAGNPLAELLDIDRPVTLEFDTSGLDYRRVVPDEDYFTIAEWEKPEAYGLPAWNPNEETSGAWAQRVGLGEQPGIVEKVVGQDNRFAYGKPVPATAIKRVRFDAYFDEDGTLVPASDWLTPEQALRVLSGEDVTPDAVGVEDTPDEARAVLAEIPADGKPKALVGSDVRAEDMPVGTALKVKSWETPYEEGKPYREYVKFSENAWITKSYSADGKHLSTTWRKQTNDDVQLLLLTAPEQQAAEREAQAQRAADLRAAKEARFVRIEQPTPREFTALGGITEERAALLPAFYRKLLDAPVLVPDGAKVYAFDSMNPNMAYDDATPPIPVRMRPRVDEAGAAKNIDRGQLVDATQDDGDQRVEEALAEGATWSQEALRDAGFTHVVLYRGVTKGGDPFSSDSSEFKSRDATWLERRNVPLDQLQKSSRVTSWSANPRYAAMFGDEVIKTVVPIEQIVSMDVFGDASYGYGLNASINRAVTTGEPNEMFSIDPDVPGTVLVPVRGDEVLVADSPARGLAIAEGRWEDASDPDLPDVSLDASAAPSMLVSSRMAEASDRVKVNDGMPSTTNITPVSRDELNDDEVLKQSWRQPFAEDNRRLSRERGQARMDGFRRAPIVIGANQAEYSKGDGYLMRQGSGAVFASPGYRFPQLPDDDAVNPDGFGYVLGPSALQDVAIRPVGSLPPEIGLTDPAPSDDLLIQMGWHDGETSALYRGKMPPDDIRGIVLLTGTAPIAAYPTQSGGEPRWRMRDSAYPAYEGTGGWDTSNDPIDYVMLPGDTVFLTAVQATDNPEQTRREMALAAAAGKDMKVLRHNGDIVEVEQVLADYESAKVTTPDDWTGPSPLAPEGNEGNRHAEYVRRVFDDAGLSQPGRAPYVFSRSHDWYEGGRAHAEDADGFVAEMREVRQGAAERMAIRVPLEVIPKIIADGRLMNQHESKQSEGTLDPRQRKDAERLLFGIPTRGGKVQDRPIYGLVETPDYRDGSQYGKFVLSLKPETARRTTMTFGDSLGVANATYGYKTEDGVRKSKKKDEPDLRGAHGAAIPMTGDVTDEQILGATQSNSSNRAYIEIQVHGGVSLDDVRSVRYSPWIQNDDQTRADLLEYAKNPLPGVTLELPQDVYDVAGPEVLDALTGAGVTVEAVAPTGVGAL